jgi:hypothetical protein
MLVCTQTEVLEFSLKDFSRTAYITHPWMNDLHHVVESQRGTLLVANTGLDMILEMDREGQVLSTHSALPGEDPWGRFSKNTDYRKVITTKPHRSHPNYSFEYKDELWISRFNQKDLLCLTDPTKNIEIGQEKTHDGNLWGNLAYCTTVDGHLFVSDLDTLKVVGKYDLNEITQTDKDLGWCRGVHILEENRVLVGFSRLRPSKFKDNHRWLRFQLGIRKKDSGGMPTRVDCFNLTERTREWSIDLEHHEMNAVFSILAK